MENGYLLFVVVLGGCQDDGVLVEGSQGSYSYPSFNFCDVGWDVFNDFCEDPGARVAKGCYVFPFCWSVPLFLFLQSVSSIEVETTLIKVDSSPFELDLGSMDMVGRSLFSCLQLLFRWILSFLESCDYSGKGFHVIFSYRGELSPIEVEIRLVGWCYKEVVSSSCSSVPSNSPTNLGSLDVLEMLKGSSFCPLFWFSCGDFGQVMLVFCITKFFVFNGLVMIYLSDWLVVAWLFEVVFVVIYGFSSLYILVVNGLRFPSKPIFCSMGSLIYLWVVNVVRLLIVFGLSLSSVL